MVTSNAIDGKTTTATEAAVAVVGGAVGAGVGAKIGSKFASKLDGWARSSNLGQGISELTRSSLRGGATVGGGASVGEVVGASGAEAAVNIAQKETNKGI